MINKFRSFFNTFHPVVITLFLGTMMSRMATSMSLPFMAIYLSINTDMNPLLIGITIGVGPLTSTLVGFIGGSLSDRIGRKIVMLGALFTWSFVFIGFAVVDQTWMFIVLSMLNGACKSCFEPVSQALMIDLTPKDLRYRVFSIRYTAANLGFAVGPMVGAFLGIAGGTVPFITTGAFFFLYACTLSVLLNKLEMKDVDLVDDKKVPVTIKAALKVASSDRILLLYLIGGTLMQIVSSQFTTTLSSHVETNFVLGVKLFALLMTINAVTVVVFQLPLSTLAEKRSPLWSITIGNCLYGIGGLGFAHSGGWTTIIISMVIFTLGEIMTFPAGNVMIDRIAPNGLRGTYFGAQNLKEVGKFIGPTIGMFMLSSYGALPLFICMAVICIVSTYFYLLGYRLESMKKKQSVFISG